MLSNLSSFVGVITTPRKAGVFRHIEFLRLGERRVLVILVAPDGDVQNRVIITASDHTQPQLIEATNFLNAHYAGLSIDDVRERLKTEVEALSADIAALMRAAVQAGSDAIAESDEQVVVSGERNLLGVQDLHHDMRSLRDMFDVFEQKTQLMRLLEGSSRAEGVRIFIGGESRVVPFEALSVVSAPYEVDGQVVGTLGVIGPTRMPYDRMIQIVDITSKLVGNALSQRCAQVADDLAIQAASHSANFASSGISPFWRAAVKSTAVVSGTCFAPNSAIQLARSRCACAAMSLASVALK
jgi:heat-inducible transcriptional repressor